MSRLESNPRLSRSRSTSRRKRPIKWKRMHFDADDVPSESLRTLVNEHIFHVEELASILISCLDDDEVVARNILGFLIGLYSTSDNIPIRNFSLGTYYENNFNRVDDIYHLNSHKKPFTMQIFKQVCGYVFFGSNLSRAGRTADFTKRGWITREILLQRKRGFNPAEDIRRASLKHQVRSDSRSSVLEELQVDKVLAVRFDIPRYFVDGEVLQKFYAEDYLLIDIENSVVDILHSDDNLKKNMPLDAIKNDQLIYDNSDFFELKLESPV